MVRLVLLLISLVLVPPAAHAQSYAVYFPSDKEMLEELNLARTQPGEYAAKLREYRQHFKGNIVYEPGKPTGIITKEGVAAVDEAIAFLERQPPLAPLAPSTVLAKAATDHVSAQGPEGKFGHYSSDGSSPGDRVQRRGGGPYVGETIHYGPVFTARDVIMSLIIDDAVPDRGHRVLIFTPDMLFAGSNCGPHKQLRVMCVTNYSQWIDGKYVRVPVPPPPAQ